MTWTIVLLNAYGYGDPATEASMPLRLSIVLAVVAGTVGSVLALQAWHRFRGAPFGRALAILPAFMMLFTLFHVILLVVPDAPAAVEVIESAAFVLLVVFMLSMVRLHLRMSRRSTGTGDLPGTDSPAEMDAPPEEGP